MIEADFELPMQGFTRCDHRWSRPAGEFADYHRCYFPVRGEAWIETGGERLTLRPGAAHFIPGNRHIAYGCEREFHVYWFHIRWLSPDVAARLTALPILVTLGAAWARSTRQAWSQLATPLEKMSQPDRVRLCALALQMLAAVIDAAEQMPRNTQRPPIDPAELRRFGPAAAYMDRHFRSNPPLAELAARAHLSPIYFHKKFSLVFGVTPHEYMLAKRMRLARRLLMQSDEPIAVVAAESGYDNAFYFSRIFKNTFGLSPRAARKQRHALAMP